MAAEDRHDEDLALVRDALARREGAFACLYEKYRERVYRVAYHFVHNKADALDLCQETFVRVYHQVTRYRGQGLFRSWLFRIAGNLARSRLRRRKILRWVHFDPGVHDLADRGPAPDAVLEEREQQVAVRAALAALPDRQREALTLHRFQGLKYREIAAVMGTSVPGVESLIQRALAALRDRLAGKED